MDLVMFVAMIVVVLIQVDELYVYILFLTYELTPSAGIAASWASAGSEG